MAPAPLVNYASSSSSSSDEIEPPPPAVTRKRPAPTTDIPCKKLVLPPLPPSFHDTYPVASRVSVSDDPTLHGGRTRQVPHVEGRWPTFAYIDWVLTPRERQAISSLLSSNGLDGEVRSLLVSDTGAPAPLHISLSATLSLASDEREPFLEALKRRVAGVRTRSIKLRISLSPRWFTEGTSSSSFLVLPVHQSEPLERVLNACNETARRFGQRELYVPTSVSRPASQSQSQSESEESTRAAAVEGSHGGEVEKRAAQFHVSIATRLKDSLPLPLPASSSTTTHPSSSASLSTTTATERGGGDAAQEINGINANETKEVKVLELNVQNVKLRIGKTVHCLPFF